MRNLFLILIALFMVFCCKSHDEISVNKIWLSCNYIDAGCIIDSVNFSIEKEFLTNIDSNLNFSMNNKKLFLQIDTLKICKNNYKVIFKINHSSDLGIYDNRIRKILYKNEEKTMKKHLIEYFSNELYLASPTNNKQNFVKKTIPDSCFVLSINRGRIFTLD